MESDHLIIWYNQNSKLLAGDKQEDMFGPKNSVCW